MSSQVIDCSIIFLLIAHELKSADCCSSAQKVSALQKLVYLPIVQITKPYK